jgi:hypothetical protein
MTGPLTYLYAVVPAAAAAPHVEGVDAEPPRLVGEGALAAVVGSVAAQRFDEEGLAAGLDDLGRLEELARAHHRVVAALADDGPVAPVRLATVYRDDDGVHRLLRERAAEFEALLRRLDACREWGVKVWLTDTAHSQAEPAAAANGRPGTAYLLRRKAEREAGARHREQGAAVADRLHTELAHIALADRVLAAQDAALSGRREEMVLNATYLVRRVDEEAFTRVVAEGSAAAGDSIQVVPTGPWPPFSFATVADR